MSANSFPEKTRPKFGLLMNKSRVLSHRNRNYSVSIKYFDFVDFSQLVHVQRIRTSILARLHPNRFFRLFIFDNCHVGSRVRPCCRLDETCLSSAQCQWFVYTIQGECSSNLNFRFPIQQLCTFENLEKKASHATLKVIKRNENGFRLHQKLCSLQLSEVKIHKVLPDQGWKF